MCNLCVTTRQSTGLQRHSDPAVRLSRGGGEGKLAFQILAKSFCTVFPNIMKSYVNPSLILSPTIHPD
eukprot:860729-Rhodomonas_salina.1